MLALVAFAGIGNSLNYVGEWFTGSEIFITGSLSIQNAIWISILIASLTLFLPTLIKECAEGERWAKVYGLFLAYSAVLILPAANTSNAVRDFLQLSFPWVIYLLASRAIRNSSNSSASLLKAFWIGGIATALLTAVMVVAGRPLFGTDYNGAIRFWGPMGWAGLGYYLLPYTYLAFSLLLTRLRLASILIFAAVIIPFLASLGRLATVSFIMGLLAIFLLWNGSARIKAILGLVGGAVAVMSAVFVAPYLLHRTFGEGGKLLFSGRDTASNYILSKLEMSTFDVIFGNGTGTARTITEELIGISAEIRSRYFVSFIDVGVIGTFLLASSLLLLLFSSAMQLRRLGRRPSLWRDTGAPRGLSSASLAMMKLGCAISIIIIFAFDNLAFVYILSIYFSCLPGAFWALRMERDNLGHVGS